MPPFLPAVHPRVDPRVNWRDRGLRDCAREHRARGCGKLEGASYKSENSLAQYKGCSTGEPFLM